MPCQFLLLYRDKTKVEPIRELLTQTGRARKEQIADWWTPHLSGNSLDVSREFGSLADWIEVALEAGTSHLGTPEVIVLTDLWGSRALVPADLDPLLGQTSNKLLALLILAFPEVYWVFTSGT